MDWIRKLKEEQQEEQQRQDQTYAEALKQASEQKERFQIVKNKLCPVIEAAIIEIKKRTGLELQMDARDTSIIVKAPNPRLEKFQMDGVWYEKYGRITDHHFEISLASNDGKTVQITAVKAGLTNRNPDHWEESNLSHADYFGRDETVINTLNDIDLLISDDLHLLFEWLVRLELKKEIPPPELSGVRQRKEQEKFALLKANLGIASAFLFLGPIAFFLGLRAKNELSSLGIVNKGHGRSNWAIGLGIFECIIIGINVSAMLAAPHRQSIFGGKYLQMRTPGSTSYPVAAEVKSIPDLSGKWKGSYIDKDAWGRGYTIWFRMELKQNGAEITGITTEQRDYRMLTARINGRVEGRVIRFVKQYNEGPPVWPVEAIQYEGSIRDDVNSISGTWNTSVLTGGWSVSRVSKNKPSKKDFSLQPAANSTSKKTSGSGNTFLKSLKPMVSVEITSSSDGTSAPVRKKYFLK